MSDEAVVRIVLEGDKGTAPTPPALSGAEQRQQSAALLRGDALPWAPPDKPIQAPVLEGMRSDQAEWLRLESEAARRSISVKDYKKSEIEGSTTAPSGPAPQAPPVPTPPVLDPHEERRLFNEERARLRASLAPPVTSPNVQASPPDAPKSAPVPVAVVEAPKPEPPPAAPPLQPAPPVVPTDRTKPFLPRDIGVGEDAPEGVGPHTYTGLPGSPLYAKRKAEGERQYPPPPPTAELAYDPVKIAKKRVEREELLAAVDAEYAKLKPPPPPTVDPPFDPVALAKKRVESDRRRAAVDAEYAKLKPPPQQSATNALLDLAQSIRGTLGGAFGTVVGAGLDIVSKVRKDRGAGTTGTAADGDVGDAASEAGSGLSTLASTVGTTVAVVGGLTVAFKALLGVANEMASRYGEYNPEIAQAQAMAEIRQMMGDMQRSQENSKEMVDLIRAQSELQQRWEDVKVALMTVVIPVLTGMLEVLGKLLGIASKGDVDEPVDPTSYILGRKEGGLGSNEMIPDV